MTLNVKTIVGKTVKLEAISGDHYVAALKVKMYEAEKIRPAK